MVVNDAEVQLHHVAGSDDAAVDVVFFHGLGGHHRDTWTNKDTGLYWPKAIHESMPNVQVWALQYPSAIFGWTKGQVGAIGSTEDIANRVRMHIKAMGLMQNSKPCIWVCHSLGGLIAKYILLKNKKTSKADRPFDDALLQGVLFLGTPHRGSNKADLGQGFLKAMKSVVSSGEIAIKGYLQALSGGVPIKALPNFSSQFVCLTKLIEDLENRNDRLWSLDSNFSQYFGERWQQNKPLFVSVVCEGAPMLMPPMLIVDKQSADPELRVESNAETVTPLTLPLNHSELSKPPNENCELFMLLRELLARIPDLYDPFKYLTNGVAGGRHAWHLARHLNWCFARHPKHRLLGAWRAYNVVGLDPTISDEQYIHQLIRFIMGDGSGESCLNGISCIAAFLNANLNFAEAGEWLVSFCDEVVGWLALVCGAPSPFEPERTSDADELVYPGYASPESQINEMLLATAHAHHKQWPLYSIDSSKPIQTVAISEIYALDPNVKVKHAVECWALGVSLGQPQSLTEYAQNMAVSFSSELSDRELILLEQHVTDIRAEQKGIVIDSRESILVDEQRIDLRASVLLPALTVVTASTTPEGKEQVKLQQAILAYRYKRAVFLSTTINNRVSL
ncbi:Putative serine esterase (DUF676) [Rheinheimera sp. A13L]|uniref:esterase/lipase family protein n=1 Tax=Rheinheimera sp. A13L TaxID=506534 RepID=UPI0002124CD4|nr:serine esterase (DUF676) [Rheinheimera sp. A13L]EGM79741.1 Putative serine esterase (DUF676) [Rheinheimera sp. A13L]